MEKNANPAEALEGLQNEVNMLEAEHEDSEDDYGEGARQLSAHKQQIRKYCPPVPASFAESVPYRNAMWGRSFTPKSSPLSEYIETPPIKARTNCIVILGVAQYPHYPLLRTLEIWTAGIFTLMRLEKRLRITTIRRASKLWFAIPSTKLPFNQLVDRVASIQNAEPVCIGTTKQKKPKRTRAPIGSEQKKNEEKIQSAENESQDEEEVVPPIGRVVNLIRKRMSVKEVVDALGDENDWEAITYLVDNKEKIDWLLQHVKKDEKSAPKKAGNK